MPLAHRVLPPAPITTYDHYLTARGGRGWEAARQLSPDALIERITESGLRGRGGAGFPTGVKWATVAANHSDAAPTSVVVNGAEGEPSTLKDRMVLRTNPFEVLEGALIAARAVRATQIIVAIKESFRTEFAIVQRAVAELEQAGWFEGIDVRIYQGPSAYLLGEETALLEAIDGRQPFPRLAPPFRRGVFEVVEDQSDVDSGSGLSAHVEMAGADHDSYAPPALVDNVETLANVPRIIWRGSEWFRDLGTADSPGTVICTFIGAVQNPGVGEVAMGTTLREAIELVAGGPRDDRSIVAVLPGVSNAVITASQLDTPLTYEAVTAVGSGLGSASFAVYDDQSDLAAVAAGASRFLFVESCGQCTPCKTDGRTISESLDRIIANEATATDVDRLRSALDTVADGARCNLARQQEIVTRSLLDAFPQAVEVHIARSAPAVARELIAELIDINDDSVVELDESFPDRQPDWTYDPIDSGRTPVERFTDHRAESPVG